eukprot:10141475-Karenia_brevis.AAC.1
MEAVGHDEDQSYWLGTAVEYVVDMASDYKRRILHTTQRYPSLLAWLVFQSPDADCPNRRRCASDLLDMIGNHAHADVTARKLAIIFRQELEEARRHGTLDVELYDLIYELCNKWDLSSQLVEGAHNTLKYSGRLAPYMQWKLLGSRLTLKKKMFSSCDRHEDYAKLVNNLVPYRSDALQQQNEPGRFQEAEPEMYPEPLEASLAKAKTAASRHGLVKSFSIHEKCSAKWMLALK